jgi:four helix bundle protein
MTQIISTKHYDLEDRTRRYAYNVIQFCKKVEKSVSNTETTKQLIRSAGSIGANYIEANEALGKKDFIMHLRISKREAKESKYWLCLVETCPPQLIERDNLICEADEFMKIFGAIIGKCLP